MDNSNKLNKWLICECTPPSDKSPTKCKLLFSSLTWFFLSYYIAVFDSSIKKNGSKPAQNRIYLLLTFNGISLIPSNEKEV